MTIPMMMKVTKLIEKCPVCGDSTVGSGSKFIVEEDTFQNFAFKEKMEGEDSCESKDMG